MDDVRHIEHEIHVQCDERVKHDRSYDTIVSQAIIESLRSEAIDMHCVVNVLITDDEGIREYNREYRNIDTATDVLSFPMQTFLQTGWKSLSEPEFDEDTGDLLLGDIVISLESVERQAVEYGNTNEYETAYLIIHSSLHLIGYDHDDETGEKIMHSKNKKIIQEMGFNINDKKSSNDIDSRQGKCG